MEKSLFEQMGGTYMQQGDYMLPNLILPAEEERPIGIWGKRHVICIYLTIVYTRCSPDFYKIFLLKITSS